MIQADGEIEIVETVGWRRETWPIAVVFSADMGVPPDDAVITIDGNECVVRMSPDGARSLADALVRNANAEDES